MNGHTKTKLQTHPNLSKNPENIGTLFLLLYGQQQTENKLVGSRDQMECTNAVVLILCQYVWSILIKRTFLCMCVQEKSRGLIHTHHIFFRENEFLLEFPLFTLRIKTVKRVKRIDRRSTSKPPSSELRSKKKQN